MYISIIFSFRYLLCHRRPSHHHIWRQVLHDALEAMCLRSIGTLSPAQRNRPGLLHHDSQQILLLIVLTLQTRAARQRYRTAILDSGRRWWHEETHCIHWDRAWQHHQCHKGLLHWEDGRGVLGWSEHFYSCRLTGMWLRVFQVQDAESLCIAAFIWGYVHTNPDKFENGVFVAKTDKCTPSHYRFRIV